ncbi:hypothetical protein M758_UG336300 [Ceratodon purpureus]|nr:hypothetical protein M758_UG336300 [Ceratodon purpureus]
MIGRGRQAVAGARWRGRATGCGEGDKDSPCDTRSPARATMAGRREGGVGTVGELVAGAGGNWEWEQGNGGGKERGQPNPGWVHG